MNEKAILTRTKNKSKMQTIKIIKKNRGSFSVHIRLKERGRKSTPPLANVGLGWVASISGHFSEFFFFSLFYYSAWTLIDFLILPGRLLSCAALTSHESWVVLLYGPPHVLTMHHSIFPSNSILSLYFVEWKRKKKEIRGGIL